MILHYTTEPLVRMECAALLTKYFYCQKHSDDPDEPYDIESYFGALCQRRHIPKEVIKERFSHFIPPLSALYRDMAGGRAHPAGCGQPLFRPARFGVFLPGHGAFRHTGKGDPPA